MLDLQYVHGVARLAGVGLLVKASWLLGGFAAEDKSMPRIKIAEDGFGQLAGNLSAPCGIQRADEDVVAEVVEVARETQHMTTWHKRDWHQFYELARRPWRKHRPPRPVYPTGLNRVLPAAGFSLSELDDAGVDLDQAESLGLPVDAGRIGAYGPNVTVLRDFVRSSRQPL